MKNMETTISIEEAQRRNRELKEQFLISLDWFRNNLINQEQHEMLVDCMQSVLAYTETEIQHAKKMKELEEEKAAQSAVKQLVDSFKKKFNMK